MAFSLAYFASAERPGDDDRYRLLIEGARFADRHGFAAVWTPERHFHAFGGLYPNPSVISAALATITERVHLRAGSVVLPLQNPLRVAEEWSVVDNLSRGRVGISIASGWHADDFVLAPDHFADRRERMARDLETVQRLWRGEAVTLPNGVGREIEVRVLPRPVQPELPVWITAAGTPDTFRLAGALGANILTHLLGQGLDDLAGKIALYRQARREHGHDPDAGQVTLMVHTFVGEDLATVRETVRQPLIDYLKTSSGLVRGLARSLGHDLAGDLTDAELEEFLQARFDRYFESTGLMGTPASCLAMVERLRAIGVDELACLIDFGVDADAVLAGLRLLDEVRQRANAAPAPTEAPTIAEQIARHGVTHLQCTPTLASMMTLDPATLAALRPLRTLLLGGEALPAALAARLGQVVSGDILNMYGPTETTVWSTTHRVDGAAGGTAPIGRPIANTAIYLLDERRRPVPVGVPGEVYIGGDGVARGYLNRPELTAERFVPDPFGPDPQARLYRTGDLARYRPDGVIEFLGRLDHQVKIRGFRIELGEIETVLGRHPAVREAVVVAREDTPGDQRLVAYVIPAGDAAPAADDLRASLQAHLPAHMVPAAIMTLAAFPTTPNGKTDRKALPAPDQARAEARVPYVAPRNETETTLVELWQRVLHVTTIGTHDNFFDLGGHSLIAMHLIAAIRDAFRVDLPLRSLFQAPTIAGLAGVLHQAQIERADADQLAAALSDLEALSDEEVQALLAR